MRRFCRRRSAGSRLASLYSRGMLTAMRITRRMLALFMAPLVGCSLSVGAGAQANLGRHSRSVDMRCSSFESCELPYRAAVAEAARCRAEAGDCQAEEREVRLRYRALYDQTSRELAALRETARQARHDAEARFSEQAQCARRLRELEGQRNEEPQSGWFDPAAR